ncbi:NAD(P)H-dependent glycerol-3-phosphate dehydrogenase [Anaerobacillus alkaliphilus]|uniref:Glycerol-3-phosphate dehydrogenase [NAD(P)+] n=1 Tax=Anaerobacillus alkaliphilus TaxID=1548597 RepID=A0A4Q0VWC3_9BACI|nr:NAD(P)H-dependent glycerol-3-phosphate dehydrogenase [Anaerobacillus alkaliphilus]RXJ03934.1 NAD(P)H-dependent glycerol-3-phosphate dehydrogenase [Anaerobacillus alkaliphilus]
MATITVFGAGSWGSALSIVLADNNHQVRLWGRDERQIQEINEERTNEKYLPGTTIPSNVKAYTNVNDALNGVEAILLVVPTKAMRGVLAEIRASLTTKVTFIHASKGIEPDSLKRISEMIEEEIPEHLRKSVVVLSGPSHAEEVSLRQPTTVTSSSLHNEEAEYVQDLFMNKHFRVYTNPDLLGVELGGALKNIIALGAGLTNGLGYGDNAKAALMTRGLAEIARLGVKLGANPLTFAGLSGLGDLIVTCTSVHSRNWRAGNLLGQGNSLDEVLANMGMAVEGVRTTKAAYQLALREGVEMPITAVLYDVLFNNKQPQIAVEELMGRVKTHEVENLSF